MVESGECGSGGWIDISAPVKQGMVHWPGDPAVQITRVEDIQKGDAATVSSISMGAHTGTHIDAPLHFLPGGIAIDEMPLDTMVGPARVIEIKDNETIAVKELEGHRIHPGERILFKTRNSALWQDERFHGDFVYLSTEAAEYLAERKVAAVGIDYLSVGGYHKNETEVHRALLGGHVWIIEGLDLSRIQAGNYDLICLPLRVEKGEAAPARAVLRQRKDL